MRSGSISIKDSMLKKKLVPTLAVIVPEYLVQSTLIVVVHNVVFIQEMAIECGFRHPCRLDDHVDGDFVQTIFSAQNVETIRDMIFGDIV